MNNDKNRTGERGAALITVLMLIAMLSTILVVYFALTQMELSLTESSMDGNRGFYAAEAGLNIRARELVQTFKSYRQPSGSSPAVTAGELPCQTGDLGSDDFECINYDFGPREVVTYTIEEAGNPTSLTIPPGERFENLTASESRYTLHSVAHTHASRAEAILGMRVNSRTVPLFQFAAFYNKDLEILPGPAMTLAGPVHTNGQLYLGAGASLTIEGQVTTTDALYHGRKEDPVESDQCSGGSVRVHDAGGSPVDLPDCGSPSPGRTEVLDTSAWGGKVQTYVQPITVPQPEILDPVPGSLYWDRADARIMYDVGTGLVQLRQVDGTVHGFSGQLNACGGGQTVDTSYIFENNREVETIRMLEVDMQKLIDCMYDFPGVIDGKALDDDTEGGLVIYLGVDGPSAGTINDYGVRVSNGQQLAATNPAAPDIEGVTIVTGQAVYVQGDYNAVAKKPAAFLADSLNVLSNAWDDDDQGAGLTDATMTTIYAAFLAGTDTTGDEEGDDGQSLDDYNGGLENYPRFHEDWNGVTLTYRGSFVSLGQPRHVDGPWDTPGVYSPPIRDWGYDTMFNDPANLPPLSPRFTYVKQELFVRDFEL